MVVSLGCLVGKSNCVPIASTSIKQIGMSILSDKSTCFLIEPSASILAGVIGISISSILLTPLIAISSIILARILESVVLSAV